MISKNEVKYIQSLSDKKNRDHDGVFVAEGPKLVTELLTNGLIARTIYTTCNPEAYITGGEIKEISEAELQRISRFETAKEVVAVFYKKKSPPFFLPDTVTLVLDGIQDPGNMGTIIRTADWFGVTQIIASEDSADCYNSKVIQSTMGSIARVHVYYEDLARLLTNTGVTIFGALLNGNNVYQTEKLKEGIIVIGNESKGIREKVLPLVNQAVSIPRRGNAESLNAAVATGILLSHLVKQENMDRQKRS